MSGRNTKRALAVIASAFVVLTICIAHARAQSPPENETKIKAPIEPLRPRITANQLFAHLETHNELRKSALYDCPVFRTYRLSDLEGIAHAEETGRMEFHAPDQKFIVASENGSKSLVPGGSGRTEGHPARKLSFWVEHADFVRQYEKIDGVGLPHQGRSHICSGAALWREISNYCTSKLYCERGTRQESNNRRWFKKASVGGWK
jgi:hypothetical protein